MPRFKAKPIKAGSVTADSGLDTRQAEATALDALIQALRPNPHEIIEPLPDPSLILAESESLSESLRAYIPRAWKLVEPATFIPNWHIDAIADHLTAVTEGDIQDLLITMPPRHSKSLIVSVLWPTWEWITHPAYRWVFASYAFSLSVRDSVKRRKILKSEWFQSRWSNRMRILEEQDTKIRYENDKHGFQLASSVGGSNTGEGGERIIADDPHNIKKSESEDVRQDTVDWWNIVMSTRRNDLRRSARVVVQQRTHEGDVAGDIIERGGYVHLNLPTEAGFAGSGRCRTVYIHKATGDTKEWTDPRTEDGELLNPLRFDEQANEKAKIDLGDYQYAAQHGQNPTPPSGTIILREWLRYYGNAAKGQPPIPDWTKATHPFTPLLSLDCTFNDHKDTDFVAGLGWAMFGADLYLLPTCIHARLNFPNTVDAIAEFVGGSSLDGSKQYPGVYPFVKVKLVETKANGPAIISTLQHRIPGMVGYEPGGAGKESRLMSASWRFRAGNIYLPDASIAPWIKEYEYELCAFPRARRDDYVDATSQALLFIGGDATTSGSPVMPEQTSRWFHITSGDIGGAVDGPSVWGSGSFTGFGSGKSVWRP